MLRLSAEPLTGAHNYRAISAGFMLLLLLLLYTRFLSRKRERRDGGCPRIRI